MYMKYLFAVVFIALLLSACNLLSSKPDKGLRSPCMCDVVTLK